MAWFWFKRGGWEIAVDAVSLKDARHHVNIFAFGAVYRGELTPPTMAFPSIATAMTTSKRQEQIHDALEREYQANKNSQP
jgi:hypothetical protein